MAGRAPQHYDESSWPVWAASIGAVLFVGGCAACLIVPDWCPPASALATLVGALALIAARLGLESGI